MTTTRDTDFLVYDRTVGMTVMEGRGFYYPVDAVVGGRTGCTSSAAARRRPPGASA